MHNCSACVAGKLLLETEARKQAGTTHRDMVRKRREGILRDLQDGLLWREIAKKHGVDEQEIWVVAKTNNIHSAGRSRGRGNPQRPPITQETEDAAVRLLRDTPKGYREIPKELSLPWRSILTRIARKHGRGAMPPVPPLALSLSRWRCLLLPQAHPRARSARARPHTGYARRGPRRTTTAGRGPCRAAQASVLGRSQKS